MNNEKKYGKTTNNFTEKDEYFSWFDSIRISLFFLLNFGCMLFSINLRSTTLYAIFTQLVSCEHGLALTLCRASALCLKVQLMRMVGTVCAFVMLLFRFYLCLSLCLCLCLRLFECVLYNQRRIKKRINGTPKLQIVASIHIYAGNAI